MGTRKTIVREEQGKGWEKISLRKIAKEVANVNLLSRQARKLFAAGDERGAFNILFLSLEKWPGSINLFKVILELLQLCNDRDIFERFPLSEIEVAYRTLVRLEPDDVDLNIEYYYFLRNVMDKESAAEEFLRQYRVKFKRKFSTQLYV